MRILGERVSGGIQVAVESERDAQVVQEEMAGNCRFVASCGCGQLKLSGSDGVQIWRLAEAHFRQTGHKCFGHFMFGESVNAGGDH